MNEGKEITETSQNLSSFGRFEKYIKERASKEKDPVLVSMFELALTKYPSLRKLPEEERKEQEALAGARFIKEVVERTNTLLMTAQNVQEALDYLREVFWFYTLFCCIPPAYYQWKDSFPKGCGLPEYILTQFQRALSVTVNKDEEFRKRVNSFISQYNRDPRIRENYDGFSSAVLASRDQMVQGVIGELLFCRLAQTAGLKFEPAIPPRDIKGTDYYLTLPGGTRLEIQVKTKNRANPSNSPFQWLGKGRIQINFLSIPSLFEKNDERELMDLLNPSQNKARQFFDELREFMKPTRQKQPNFLKSRPALKI